MCSHEFPTRRFAATRAGATGTATALAVGRGGGIVSAFVGAAAITHGGSRGFLILLAMTMIAAALAVLLVKRHIPSLARRGAGSRPVLASH